MKSTFLFFLSFLCMAGTALAQQPMPSKPARINEKARLNLYGAYTFDDRVDSYYSNSDYFEGTIKGGFQWGAGIEYMVRPEYGVELLYYRIDTDLPLTYFDNGVKANTFNLSANSIMLAGNRYARLPNPAIEPFGGLMLGMSTGSIENPNNGRSEGYTKFAYGFRGGINLYPAGKIGVKLQAQLLSVPQAVGGGFYIGTGGISTGVSSYSSMMQFSLGGGLVFKLGN